MKLFWRTWSVSTGAAWVAALMACFASAPALAQWRLPPPPPVTPRPPPAAPQAPPAAPQPQPDASAAPAFDVRHNPPPAFFLGNATMLSIDLEEETGIEFVTVQIRPAGSMVYQTLFMSRTKTRHYETSVPADFLRPGDMQYYIAASVRGQTVPLFATAEQPQVAQARLPRPDEMSLLPPPPPAPRPEGIFPEVSKPIEDSSVRETEFGRFAQDQVIESVSRARQRASESPAAVSVLTEDDLVNYGSPLLGEALRQMPGMDVMRINAADFNVNVRGFNRENSNRLLSLVDGRSVYVDIFGITFWEGLPTSYYDYKRVEVIRGPGSTIYGANAFSGIVSLFTKEPEDVDGLRLYQWYGSAGNSSTFQGGHVRGKHGVRVTAEWNYLNELEDYERKNKDSIKGNFLYRLAINPNTQLRLQGGFSKDDGSFLTQIGPLAFDVNQAFAQATFIHKKLRLQGFVNYLGADATIRPLVPDVIQLPPDGQQVVDDFASKGLVLRDRSGRKLTGLIQEDLLGEVPLIRLPADSITADAEGQYALEIGSMDTLTFGANYRLVSLQSSNLLDTDITQNALGLFLLNELRPVDMLFISAGLRFDLQDLNYEDPTRPEIKPRLRTAFSPRGAVVFKPGEDHSLRLSGGLAYRNPALFESSSALKYITARTVPGVLSINAGDGSIPVDNQIPDIIYRGNPTLKPEQMLSAELGYSGLYWDRLRLGLDLFWEKVDGLIVLKGDVQGLVTGLTPSIPLADKQAATANIFIYENLIDAANMGLELSSELRIIDGLKLFANYSFQKTSLLNQDEVARSLGIEPSRVPDFITINTENPEHKINFGVNSRFHGVRANLYGHYVARTIRKNFLTQLPSQDVSFDIRPPEALAGAIQPYKTEPRALTALTNSFGTFQTPSYFILNTNLSYSFGESEWLTIGGGADNLLGAWTRQRDQGFVYETDADGNKIVRSVQRGRHIQYPRLNLFNTLTGGDTIGASYYFFLRGHF
ncbi:MAG: Vitamin B12 transporter BtuB [Myxococcota bacterium]|nr:Vitamin B12 transporter BtuB [Myxococcota bacterium]